MAAQVELALQPAAQLPSQHTQSLEEAIESVSRTGTSPARGPRELFDRYMADVKKTALLSPEKLNAIAREAYIARYKVLKTLSLFPPCSSALIEQFQFHRDKGFTLGNFLTGYGDQSVEAKDALAQFNKDLGKDVADDTIEDEELLDLALNNLAAYSKVYKNAEPHVRRSPNSAIRKKISETYRYIGLRYAEYERHCDLFEQLTHEVQRFADFFLSLATQPEHLGLLDRFSEADINKVATKVPCESRRQFHIEATRLRLLLDDIGLSIRECLELRADYDFHRAEQERAVNEIIKSNLLLSARQAIRQRPEDDRLFDTCQEANEGLIIAAYRYDYWKGFAFSTYACHWINQRLGREKNRTINSDFAVPVSIATRATKIFRLREKAGEYHGAPQLTAAQIASKVNCTVAQVDEAQTAYNAITNCEELYTSIPCHKTDASCVAQHADMKKVVREALDTLPGNKREICKLRWGIDTKAPMTLAQLSERFDITVERVRLIEHEGLAFLRKCSYSDDLRDLLATA